MLRDVGVVCRLAPDGVDLAIISGLLLLGLGMGRRFCLALAWFGFGRHRDVENVFVTGGGLLVWLEENDRERLCFVGLRLLG